MNAAENRHPLIRNVTAIAKPGEPFRHPLNPNSEIYLHDLSLLTGLRRIGLSIGRVPAGRESFVYHSHQSEEEFVFVISGRGIADIDDREYEVGPGDFMGFPCPSLAHHLRNPFTEDLVYLMGGERRSVEIGDYPRLRKRGIRVVHELQLVDWDNLRPFWKSKSER